MTVIWFSSGFKSAAFDYIALPTTYLLRHIVWDSFLLCRVYRREWFCCWFISKWFCIDLLFVHSTDFIEHFLELGSVLVSEERRTVSLWSSPKEMYILGRNSHTQCAVYWARKKHKKLCEDKTTRIRLSVGGWKWRDSDEGSGGVRLNFSEEKIAKYYCREHKGRQRRWRKEGN